MQVAVRQLGWRHRGRFEVGVNCGYVALPPAGAPPTCARLTSGTHLSLARDSSLQSINVRPKTRRIVYLNLSLPCFLGTTFFSQAAPASAAANNRARMPPR